MKILLCVIALLMAAWSAAWFWGKNEIRVSLDTQIEMWRGQGVAASYDGLEIGGFPFTYDGRIVGPRSVGAMMTAQGAAVADWQAEWLDFDTSLADFGVVNFRLPPEHRARVSPRNAPSVALTIRSASLGGTATRAVDSVRIEVRGGAVEVEAVPASGEPLSLSMDSVFANASAPVQRSGEVEGSLRLSQATVNAAVWNLIDPYSGFPREPVSLSADLAAEVTRVEDGTSVIRRVTLRSLVADVAGLSVGGEGQATLEGGTPEGEVVLDFNGLRPFIMNAAKAGFLPQSQAGIYSSMLGNFARRGEGGRQVFQIAFRQGFIYVNGLPTFIPVPRLQ